MLKVRIKKAWETPLGNPCKVGTTANITEAEYNEDYHEVINGTPPEKPKKKSK